MVGPCAATTLRGWRAAREWRVTDDWSVSAMPRIEMPFGGVGRLVFVVPVCARYSWYVMSAWSSHR